MTANLQPNDELNQTPNNNEELPETTIKIQEGIAEASAEEPDDTEAAVAEAVEAEAEAESQVKTEVIAAANAAPDAEDTVEPTAEATPDATEADGPSSADEPTPEIELTAERPALTEADQEYYGFAVTGNPDGDEPVTPLWERVTPGASTERPKPKRLARIALVGAVAIVSFIAGGLASRMSSQMPVLFGQGDNAQSVASYTPHATQRDAEDEADPSTTTTWNDDGSSRTTTKDEDKSNRYTIPTDDDSADSSTNKSPRGKDKTKDDTSGGSSNKRYYNDYGDESISYNSDDDTYTIDYDGYTFTIPTDEMIDEELFEHWLDTDSYYDDYYYYDDETGYDTEEDRDRRSWRGQSGEDTSYDWEDGYDSHALDGWGGYNA
ncbi:MAG: hypothetical protein J6D34_08360 [Atopobiaceae bacterium]|nr:hypothetical protein [Atopobiaceae bacterium]